MTITTSSWFAKLDPAQYTRIGISRGTPRGQSGFRRYTALNPGPWFNSVSPDEYRRRYFSEVLNRLDPARVVADLEEIADGRIAALLCWEPPSPITAFCHRGFVSAWLADELGIDVLEIGERGSGWRHPKIPPTMRRGDQQSFSLL